MARSCSALVSGVTGRCTNSTPNHSATSAWSAWLEMHDRDVDLELAAARPGEKIDEAVRLLRHQHPDPRDVVGEAHRALHAEAVDDGTEGGLDLVPPEVAAVEQELDSLEEHTVGAVGVLLGVDDVAAVAVDEVGGGGDDARLVGTRQQQDRRRRGHAVHPERLTTRPATRRVMPAGETLENAAAVWLSTPGIDTERPRSRSRSAAATTASADCHTNSGRSRLAELGALVELGVGVAGADEHHV